jgi:hypothetical protein
LTGISNPSRASGRLRARIGVALIISTRRWRAIKRSLGS